MPSNTYRPIVRYPAPLRMQIAQADNLARALGALSGKASDRELGFLWLLGRADEVRTLVDEVVREWSDGTIDTAYACEAIGSYVGAVHVALHRRYGGYGASCCGPHLEPFDGPSVRSVTPRGMRAPLESGVQALSPAHLAEEDAPRVARVAPRKSTG